MYRSDRPLTLYPPHPPRSLTCHSHLPCTFHTCDGTASSAAAAPLSTLETRDPSPLPPLTPTLRCLLSPLMMRLTLPACPATRQWAAKRGPSPPLPLLP